MPEIAKNKRAYFDYNIIETYEAGIELLGLEVKSARNGGLNLAGSYVIIRGNEAWLLNADLRPYQPMNTPSDYDSKRTRRLLLNNKEIKELISRSKESNLTIVPLRATIKGRFIKLEIGLAKSKKKTDKREAIKKRESDRDIKKRFKV
ncbi:MAG TPA: SsrA-binding protein SmpB [Candidatus Paceibacterota bacterium]